MYDKQTGQEYTQLTRELFHIKRELQKRCGNREYLELSKEKCKRVNEIGKALEKIQKNKQ